MPLPTSRALAVTEERPVPPSATAIAAERPEMLPPVICASAVVMLPAKIPSEPVDQRSFVSSQRKETSDSSPRSTTKPASRVGAPVWLEFRTI